MSSLVLEESKDVLEDDLPTDGDHNLNQNEINDKIFEFLTVRVIELVGKHVVELLENIETAIQETDTTTCDGGHERQV